MLLTTAPALAQACDPNYAGSCVPDVWPEDVDCVGGKGNGPYYTDGTRSFEVIGEDRYDLDTNDPDNLACEPPRS
jgi:resuscitation-promoting factor RpfB